MHDEKKEDSEEYKKLETTGYSPEEKKNTIRFLINIRISEELPDELADLQDE